MKKSIAVVGAGNVLFNDEGIGIYAIRYLKENYEFPDNVDLVDGGVLGFKLMVYYQEYDYCLILDTITMADDTSGSIYNIPSQELLGLGSYKQTAHEVEIVEMLEICSLLDKFADTRIIGIVPDDIECVTTNLSPTLKKEFKNFVNTALSELEKLGVKYTKKENEVSLEDIMKMYREPKAQRDLEHLKG